MTQGFDPLSDHRPFGFHASFGCIRNAGVELHLVRITAKFRITDRQQRSAWTDAD